MKAPRDPLKRGRGRRQARREELSARLRKGAQDPKTEAAAGASKASAARKASAASKASAARKASAEGIRATTTRLRQTAQDSRPALGRAARALGPLLRSLFWIPLRLLALLESLLRGGGGMLAAIAAGAASRADRVLTPERVVVVVIVAAAACLGVSQFTDYRGVEVGQPGYADVASVAPPPQIDKQDARSAHGYALILLAVLAVVLAILALATGRWKLGRLVALAGVGGIAVSLLIDMPKGLDEGDAAVAYTGVKATLNDGFYAQVAASGALVLGGLLLSMHVRRAVKASGSEPVRRRRRSKLPSAPSIAGGRT